MREVAVLNAALRAYREQPDKTDLAPLRNYLRANPLSPWRIALLTNLGLLEYHYGYFSRAMDAWTAAWDAGRSAASTRLTPLVDRAVGELIRMHARLGHADELTRLLEEVKDRPLTGPATEWVAGAREGLWMMRNEPGVAFLCGPSALRSVLNLIDPSGKRAEFLDGYRSSRQGVSLAEVERLAAEAKLDWRAAVRTEKVPVPVPSIIHWKLNHYAAIVGEDGGRYHIKDPTFGTDLWIPRQALEAEASGFFLVPAATIAEGWRPASEQERRRIHGMGYTSSSDPDATSPDDVGLCGGGAGSGSGTGSGTSSDGLRSAGCAGYGAHLMVVSLNIIDTPVRYTPGRGPAVAFTVRYNQREARQPATFSHSNLGQKWTHDYLAYIQDDPNAPTASVVRIVGGGGARVHSGFNSGTGQFASETRNGAILARVSSSPIRYELREPDGSKRVFGFPDGATAFPSKVFLTAIVDPAGNAVSLAYDAQRRLTTITDASGRIGQIGYANTDSLKITSFTDAAGRIARFDYDASGRLNRITDAVGIVSGFTYDGASTFINSKTTPYGTTQFAFTETISNGPWRTLDVTDPRGERERIEYRQSAPGIPFSETVIPAGMTLHNVYIDGRNTFHWDKHANRLYPGDYTKARIYHWMHSISNVSATARVLESTKQPLERRIWFNYPGMPYAGSQGTLDKPSLIGRVHDNGVTQLASNTYNTQGNLTRTIDPAGRDTFFDYAANGVDVIAVRQKTSASGYSTIAQATWNSQHRPAARTDAAGRVTNHTYNAFGQITSETNAKGETTQYVYDSLGYLQQVINPQGTVQASFTYDAAGNLASRTDSEGYTVTYQFDGLNRLTQATYPDGTREIHGYTALDRTSYTDRLGRTTIFAYDAVRDLISVTEAIDPARTRVTRYDYYSNGALKTLTDGNGNVTTWERDIQRRVTRKVFANGSAINYTYDSSGRRTSQLDALGQSTAWRYTVDDRLSGISYANAVNPTPNVSFSWDPFFPRITAMSDGYGTTSYSYHAPGIDGALQLAVDDGPWPSDNITHAYDPLGRLLSRTVQAVASPSMAATATTQFTYDNLGRITAATHGELGPFVYGYLGTTAQVTTRATSPALPPVISSTYAYETNINDRRLNGIRHVFNDFAAVVADSYTYTTDALGNIASMRGYPQWSPGTTVFNHSYGYDLLNRVTTKTALNGTTLFVNDLADNLTTVANGGGSSEPTQSISVNTLNQIVVRNGLNHTFDANGNLLSDGQRSYAWDAADRLVRITYADGSSTQFGYDGLSRRATMTEGGATTRYRWCGEQLCQAMDANGVVLRRNYAEGEVVQGAAYVYATDHLGSVRNVVAGNGQWLATFDYDTYGRRSSAQCAGACPPVELGYAGLIRHARSGLSLATYRAYDADSGRWVQSDPIGLAGGINTYAYVGGNPLSRIDPLGLADLLLTFGFGGTVVASPTVVPSGGLGGSVNVTFNLTSGQVAIQVGGHGLVGGGIFAGIELQGGIGFSNGPLTTGSSPYATAEAGLGFGPSRGGQVQISPDGGQISTGVGRFGAGFGVYGAVGGGTQWTWASPSLADFFGSGGNRVECRP